MNKDLPPNFFLFQLQRGVTPVVRRLVVRLTREIPATIACRKRVGESTRESDSRLLYWEMVKGVIPKPETCVASCQPTYIKLSVISANYLVGRSGLRAAYPSHIPNTEVINLNKRLKGHHISQDYALYLLPVNPVKKNPFCLFFTGGGWPVLLKPGGRGLITARLYDSLCCFDNFYDLNCRSVHYFSHGRAGTSQSDLISYVADDPSSCSNQQWLKEMKRLELRSLCPG